MQDFILSSLNSEQQKAVLQKDGPILIVAGAGSGKTRVLTNKIALLLRDGVAPQQILALTFTKKAAGEMRNRIGMMVGDAVNGLNIGTFHSVFIRFLRQYHEYIGFPENFTIYDENDSQSAIKECIGETLYGPQWNNKETLKTLTKEQKESRKKAFQTYKPKTVQSIISFSKNDLLLPRAYKQDPEKTERDKKTKRPRLGDIYELYMKKCRKAGAMDFDDILVYMHHLLTTCPAVCEQLANQFHYILVDEYQDTNIVQYDIIKRLSAVHRNICVVGDDSQSIYAFRGAKIQNILSFKDDYPDLKTFHLDINYRSTDEIVSAANRLISHNNDRLPKQCVASRGKGEPILLQTCADDREEARFVADYITDSIHLDGARFSDYAVLYRTNAQARAIEDAFIKSHIPYVIYAGQSFFDRAEVKDVLAYMRLVINHDDDEAFKRICNRPARGISDDTLAHVLSLAAASGRSAYQEAADAEPTEDGLKKRACDALRAFVQTIASLAEETASMNAYEAASLILEKSGIVDYYSNEEGEDGLKRSNNIKEVLNSILYFMDDRKNEYYKGYTDGPLRISLLDYLEDVALLSNADTRSNKSDNVALMTSHSSKGLEFKTVFVIGVEQGLFPLVRDDSAFDVEEERRLFYVSITRAMNQLVLTTCLTRWKYGAIEEAYPSTFIKEMGID